jgi:hypothetical protein
MKHAARQYDDFYNPAAFGRPLSGPTTPKTPNHDFTFRPRDNVRTAF